MNYNFDYEILINEISMRKSSFDDLSREEKLILARAYIKEYGLGDILIYLHDVEKLHELFELLLDTCYQKYVEPTSDKLKEIELVDILDKYQEVFFEAISKGVNNDLKDAIIHLQAIPQLED